MMLTLVGVTSVTNGGLIPPYSVLVIPGRGHCVSVDVGHHLGVIARVKHCGLSYVGKSDQVILNFGLWL